MLTIFHSITLLQTSSDGNQTTSTLSITLSRSDAGKYLSCKAYNHMSPTDALEDGWRLDIQCKYCEFILMLQKNKNFYINFPTKYKKKKLEVRTEWECEGGGKDRNL